MPSTATALAQRLSVPDLALQEPMRQTVVNRASVDFHLSLILTVGLNCHRQNSEARSPHRFKIFTELHTMQIAE